MTTDRVKLFQGTLDLLVLQTLIFGPRHGHGVATAIEEISEKAFLIDHGSLYPALQRLERAKLITSARGTSENNRRARFYSLTPRGRRWLSHETSNWEKMVRAVARILKPQEAP